MKEDNNAKPVSTDTPKELGSMVLRIELTDLLRKSRRIGYAEAAQLIDRMVEQEGAAALSPQSEVRSSEVADAKRYLFEDPTPSDITAGDSVSRSGAGSYSTDQQPATLREQIEQAIIFNTKHLSTYHPSMKNVIVDMEMLCDQLLALVDQYSDKRVREELAEVRNIAWDSSGDGSNLGKAYELIVTAKLNHHSKEAE